MALEILARCSKCGGRGLYPTDEGGSCDQCGGDGVQVIANLQLNDIVDTLNDILDKCNDIFEKVSEP